MRPEGRHLGIYGWLVGWLVTLSFQAPQGRVQILFGEEDGENLLGGEPKDFTKIFENFFWLQIWSQSAGSPALSGFSSSEKSEMLLFGEF